MEYPKRIKFLVWTILNQDKIRNHFIAYVSSFSFILMLLGVFNIIPIENVISGIFIGGIILIALCYVFIEVRRYMLRCEPDQNRREILHEAMILYISKKRANQ